MNVFDLRNRLITDYGYVVRGFMHIQDERSRDKVEEELRTGLLWPSHLAEQWQKELNNTFRLDAELVLPSTASRLERPCHVGQSLFELYPHVVVSLDFIRYVSSSVSTLPGRPSRRAAICSS